MNGLCRRALAFATAAAMMTMATPQADAQDLSSQVQGQVGQVGQAQKQVGAALDGANAAASAAVNDAVNSASAAVDGAVADATAEWNKFVQMANESLPDGSSLPAAPVPAQSNVPQGQWHQQAPAPVGNGSNGEIFGAGRSYLVWVPRNYNPAQPTPVMVGYSALDDSTENFRNYSRLRESAVGANAIIVYPRAIGASWEGSPTAKTAPGEDIRFVRAMIDDVQRYYNIDRHRIYATGMSTGGGMAAVSACHMADLFAGVAGVSGAYYAPVNQGCQNLPIAFMALHGMADTLTPYNGGSRWGTPILPVPALFASYERRNGCTGGVDRAPLGNNATRVSARGCRKGVEVIQVHGSNHFWWYDPSAADEMWAFLSKHSK